jgi:hypothetical protein
MTGERVIAAAVTAGTSRVSLIPELLDVVDHPSSPFEQYTVLDAIRKLYPKASQNDRELIDRRLLIALLRGTINNGGGDSSRVDLYQQIGKGFRPGERAAVPA